MAAAQIYFFIVVISVGVKGLTLDEMMAKASEHSDIQMHNDIILDDKASTAKNLDFSSLRIHREKRVAVRDKNKRWTNKTIPYRISILFRDEEIQIIEDAMEEWANYTCVRFRPRRSDNNYVDFLSSEAG